MPDKERVVLIKPERSRKGLSHIGADLTDAERKERAQKQLERMQEMVDIASGRPESRLSTGIADGDRLHMW
jgi:hypothetical protein